MAYNFDTIAAHYDSMNRLMTLGLDRRWRRRAVKELGRMNDELQTPNSELRTPNSSLDVACGTGDMVVELMRCGHRVTGADISEEMLAVARRKAEGADLRVADVERLPFADGSFDAVTCAFGVRNFVHLEQGLVEMERVLKPGGRLLVLELATPDSALVRPLYNLYTRRIIPWLGARIAANREAYTYLPRSIDRFPKGEAMLGILRGVGFDSPRQRKFTFGVCRMYTATKNKGTAQQEQPLRH